MRGLLTHLLEPVLKEFLAESVLPGKSSGNATQAQQYPFAKLTGSCVQRNIFLDQGFLDSPRITVAANRDDGARMLACQSHDRAGLLGLPARRQVPRQDQ
jgi:hypothetical protein